MIKNAFELFREPFDRANINRDLSLDRDSNLAALTARVQYLAQIVVSAVSVPFLILAGICDLLMGECNLNMPIAIFNQLFVILPISLLGLILPMSWSRSLDNTFSKCTQDQAIERHQADCLPYLEDKLRGLERAQRAARNPNSTIEMEDLEKAIREKNKALSSAAQQLDLAALRRDTLAAPRGSIEQSELYEKLRKKEQHLDKESRKPEADITRETLAKCGTGMTIEQLTPQSLAYRDYIEILARKRANGAETIPELQAALAQADTQISRDTLNLAILKKMASTHTMAQLDRLDNVQLAEEVRAVKNEKIDLLALCEKIEILDRPPHIDPVHTENYALALAQKRAYIAGLANAHSFETLRAEMESSRSPTLQSDRSSAIVGKYFAHNSYSELQRLSTQNPKDAQLLEARDKRDRAINSAVLGFTVEILEEMTVNAAREAAANRETPAAEAWAIELSNGKEVLRRKYHRSKTIQELEAMLAPDARLQLLQEVARDALEEKRRSIQNLIDTTPLARLAHEQNNEREPIRKDMLRAAREQKQAKIEGIIQAKTYEQLNSEHHRAPNNTMLKSDLHEALEKKKAALTLLVRDNTLEQLQAQLAAVPDDQAVTKKDLTFVVKEKQRHLAAAAAQPPAPAPAPAANPAPATRTDGLVEAPA